ncbi:MAG: S1C family serine protease [Planctomycetota bacterium]|jgi:S1-C subfamily serine protease
MKKRWLAAVPLLAAVSIALAEDSPKTSSKRALEIVRQIEKNRVDLAEKLAPTVCAVFRGQGGGSGVIITEDGLVLSNFHVTELSPEMRIGLNDNKIHPAAVLGVDPSGDLSLLRLKEDRKWKFTPLGDSDAMRQGDWVYAMGNPFLLATDFTPTITLGVVSGINRYQPGSIRGQLLYPDCIQTDASINPGNSGGPLFNFRGEVVGINGRVSLRERGRVNIGVGYAISSNQIKYCLPDLRAGLIVQHGTLNATVRDIEDAQWPGGIRITFDQILKPGAAFDAGIRLGDALIAFQGKRLRETNEFSRHISVLPKGRRVNLRVARLDDDKWVERDLNITLDGIQLVKSSIAKQRKAPKNYVDHEIDRTFAAARGALQSIDKETRKGTIEVRGREPLPWAERYADGKVAVAYGDKELGGETLADVLSRATAWNDAVAPDARKRFKSVKFVGGALINGVTVDRIEVETNDGAKRAYFIKLETGRIFRIDLYADAWAKPISLLFEDWRTAGGLQRPYRVKVFDAEKESLMQTIRYEAVTKS